MTTATVTWPTMAEYHEISSPIGQAIEDMRDIVGRLEDIEDRIDHIDHTADPTLAEFGALACFVSYLEQDVISIQEQVTRMKDISAFAVGGVKEDSR